MSIATDLLPFFRTQWANRLTDSCIVKRRTGSTLNQTTGVNEPTYTTAGQSGYYEGPCLVRPLSAAAEDAGQELVATRGYQVFIPYTEDDQLPEDLVDITSATDTFLTGKTIVVTNVHGDTYNTRRALICEEVVSG